MSEKRNLLDRIGGIMGDHLRTINSYFGANVTIKLYSDTVTVDKNGEPKGFLKDTISGQIDFVLNRMISRGYWKMQSSSISENSMCIVSQKQSIVLADELASTRSIKKCFIFTLINAILIVALKYVMRLSFSTASLEFILILTGSAFQTRLRYWSEKMFFLTLIVSANLLSSFFLGSLESAKTKPRWKIIDSIDDLNESNLNVYILKSHVNLLPQIGYNGSFTVISDISECYNEIMKLKPNIACLQSCFPTKLWFNKNKLAHVVEYKRQIKPPTVLTTAIDWPLYKKFNSVLKRSVESGLASFYEKNHILRYSSKNETYSQEQEIDSTEMRIAFLIFIGGLALAFLIFCVEFLHHKFKKVFR